MNLNTDIEEYSLNELYKLFNLNEESNSKEITSKIEEVNLKYFNNSGIEHNNLRSFLFYFFIK